MKNKFYDATEKLFWSKSLGFCILLLADLEQFFRVQQCGWQQCQQYMTAIEGWIFSNPLKGHVKEIIF